MYNVVIVEDELIEMESIERIALKCIDNVVVHKASTGKKAIKLIDELDEIDLMLVDINIPLPNGKEVIDYLRSKNDETKVVVTTANDDFDMLRDMLNLQIQDYLLKPIRQKVLSDVIQNTLGFDENKSLESKKLKEEIKAIFESKDYALWNDYVFELLNDSYNNDEDSRVQVSTLIDTLIIFIDSLGEGYDPARSKLNALSEYVSRLGLTKELYPRLLFSLFDVGNVIFTPLLKKQSSNVGFISRAKFHIDKNIFGSATLDDIADKTFVSSCYLSRAFKKSENIGFSNYITKRKLMVACSLLKFSDLKINTISLELAWKDSNYFCRIFKKEVGISPSDYRELNS